MTSRLRPIVLLAALLLATISCGSRTAELPADAPGFQGSIDGFDLNAYKGRVVILNFWATWCTPCRVEIPDLIKLRKNFSEKDLAIIGVSVDARGEADKLDALLQQFVSRYGINYPVYLDSQQKLAAGYDPDSEYMRFVPTTVVIDQRGKIFDTHFGVPRNAQGKVDPYGVLGGQVQNLLDGA
ncbi:MAG: TlpA disulfide reductase family protein [bacterium]|nr:TlpA disulfide reductase family protein [bacterium]